MPALPILALIPKCKTTMELNQILSHTITTGLSRFTFIISKILASFALNGDVNQAHTLFSQIPSPNVFLFNSMIMGLSQTSIPQMGISLFACMRHQGVDPNHRTFTGLVNCCVCCSWLDQIHCLVVRFGHFFDAHVNCSLVNMYANCGEVEFARRVFDESGFRNVVCWTSLFSGYARNGMVDEARCMFDLMRERNDVACSAMVWGYVRNGLYDEVIGLFRELRNQGKVRFRGSLLVGVLNACAAVGALEEGNWVHRYVDLNGLGHEVETGTALIDFYAKCGCVGDAIGIFQNMDYKDVMTWTAMIMGLSLNGENQMGLDLFNVMEKDGPMPNAVTFLAVLTACNHKTLVSKAWLVFGRMSKVYGISPRIEHYGCMVDLLARAGLVKEAEMLINMMPVEPDGAIWCSLLNGCLVHGHAQLGIKVGRVLTEFEPQHSGWCILLSNTYAAWGSWGEVISLRETMKKKGVVTWSAWSFIEVDGIIHKFLVDDKTHYFASFMHSVLNQLSKQRDCYFLDGG